jgi:hypothetical protein
MKKGMKKLRLHRETLLNLNESLSNVVGGATLDPTNCGTQCATCNRTDTCTHCSNTCP